MDIMQVVEPLVCTQRHVSLYQSSLRVLRDAKGQLKVAVDCCSARPGSWVYVVSGSAARYACGDFSVLTDLTIGGIIDFWDEESGQLMMPTDTEC